MGKEFGEEYGESVWNLAKDWNLGGLLDGMADPGRQERFTRDVNTFLDAGQGAGTSGAQGGAASANAPDMLHPDTVAGLHSFVKTALNTPGTAGTSGQTETPGAQDAQTPVNGAAAPATGSVSGEVRAPVNPDEKNRADWERLKGFDQQTKDVLRRQQERENWDRLKGLDPETQKRIHGPSWPAEGKINSPFGERFHPTKQIWKKHNGIDISNPLDADVYSSESGYVSSTKPGSDGGNQVRIKHRDGTEGIYYHVTPSVREGQKVYAGDRVGNTDMTGESTGPHLHYGVYDHKYRTHVDPATRLPKKE